MLTVIRSARKVRRFITYDLEWIPGTLEVRCVGVYDGSRYRCYRTVDQFLAAEMTNQNRGKWFYAHAGGLADVQFVFEAIIQRHMDYDIEASFSGSSAIIAHVRKKGGHNIWHFVDSFWLFRDGLAAIARSIGMEKTGPKALEQIDGEEVSQESIKEWYATAPMSELIPYNQNDCEILWRAIDQFETRLLEMGGQLQMTIASCAMQLFRRSYLTKDVATNARVNEVGRLGYFASRVEVHNTFCRGGYYYDINSSFPYAMTEPVPGELKRTYRDVPSPGDTLYMSDVSFSIPDIFLPPIPTRVDGRLFFPTGEWRSWLTGIDVELLQREGGKINKVHETLTFSPMNDLQDYAQDIYARRKAASDPFDKLVLKYLLNSLYGKFAEKKEKDKLHVFPTVATLNRFRSEYTPEERDAMLLMPGAYLERTVVDVAHEHVPISAYITARARQTLYDYMSKSRDYHYCDTDGFSTTDQYDTSDNIGDLKLEKIIDEAYFAAPKVYELKGKVLGKNGWQNETIVKAKGFSLGKGKRAIARFEGLIENGEIEIERMARIREVLSKGGGRGYVPYESTIKKRFHEKLLTKRFHYPDGETRPWHISELL